MKPDLLSLILLNDVDNGPIKVPRFVSHVILILKERARGDVINRVTLATDGSLIKTAL